MPSLGVLWAQYGPYHFARVSALKSHAASQPIHALEIASRRMIMNGADRAPRSI